MLGSCALIFVGICFSPIVKRCVVIPIKIQKFFAYTKEIKYILSYCYDTPFHCKDVSQDKRLYGK